MFCKSSINPGPVGSQLKVLRVHWLDAGISSPAKCANHPKCWAAFSGGIDTAGTFSTLPSVSAISLRVLKVAAMHFGARQLQLLRA